MTAAALLAERGWVRLPHDPAVASWAAAAWRAMQGALNGGDWRCGGTWFVGVDALPNDAAGAIGGVALPPGLLAPLPAALRPAMWHRAQVSVICPGYPQPAAGETAAAHGYRLRRDAAHVDGLLPVGPARRRHLQEPHAFILGLPLTACSPDASPLTVWEGSHRVIGAALRAAFAPHPAAGWADVDITEAYHAARRRVFDTCARVVLPARPGEATLLHRHTLHGTAPWPDGASAPPEGRAIAYLRPHLPHLPDWVTLS